MSDRWKGVALPWNNTIRGTIEPKDDKEVIMSSVLWIVLTRFGERVMLPEFGSNLTDALFEPNDTFVMGTIKAGVEEAIRRWDDRVTWVDVEATTDENTLIVKVRYQIADPAYPDVQLVAFQISPDGVSF